jgi:AcrR family transcriptional regulator
VTGPLESGAAAQEASPEEASCRRQRSDALRNRQRIIEVANDAFRDEGLDVSVAEIARRAGVGSGTLFRNFPTKSDLIVAIIQQHVDTWIDVLERANEREDTGDAFAEFFSEAVKFSCSDRGMLEAVKEGIVDQPQLIERKERAYALTEQLIARAQKAGAVRKGLTADDIYALSNGVAHSANIAIDNNGADPSDAYEPYLQVVLAGLRPGA